LIFLPASRARSEKVAISPPQKVEDSPTKRAHGKCTVTIETDERTFSVTRLEQSKEQYRSRDERRNQWANAKGNDLMHLCSKPHPHAG